MILGTHHSVDPIRLDRYLAETVHRFNNRVLDDATLFTKTAGRVAGLRITYQQLTAGTAA